MLPRHVLVDPLEVAGLTNVIAISAGGDDSFALKSDGTLWAWGDNGDGQLSDTVRPRPPATGNYRVN